MARCVRALVDGDLAEHLCETTEPDVKQWIFSMIDTLSHAAFARLAVTLRAIWWTRRKAIHEEVYQSPSATHQFICRFIAGLEVLPVSLNRAPAARTTAMAKPKAPPPGFAKIHVDAALARS